MIGGDVGIEERLAEAIQARLNITTELYNPATTFGWEPDEGAAASAFSATLGLVEPESSGLGGGAFMLLRTAKDGRDVFVDARERAPLAATRDMFLDAQGNAVRQRSIDGALAAAIPGLPAGLEHLAERYGRLPLSKSLAPAIRLAREGWSFGPKNAAMLGYRAEVLAKDRAAAALFLRAVKELLEAPYRLLV